MKFEMPVLPYEHKDLAPVISEETIGFHWGKHVQTYVNNLNNLVSGTSWEDTSLEEIIRKAEGGVYNNAAQVWNHVFYFQSFTPKGGSLPTGDLLQAINAGFGNLDDFKKKFVAEGVSIFGSGWVWLVKDAARKLSIIKASNADNPIKNGFTPLLTFDVWEHAYYLDFQNRRADHLNALWVVVNWEIVNERFGK